MSSIGSAAAIGLEQQSKQAASDVVSRHRFDRYHANRVVASLDRFLPADLWAACEGELSDWTEADAIGAGVDLGGQDDLAAFARQKPTRDLTELECETYFASDCAAFAGRLA